MQNIVFDYFYFKQSNIRIFYPSTSYYTIHAYYKKCDNIRVSDSQNIKISFTLLFEKIENKTLCGMFDQKDGTIKFMTISMFTRYKK